MSGFSCYFWAVVTFETLKPRPHYVGEIWRRCFTLKTHQMFSAHTTRGIWKRNNPWSFWIWGKLGQGYHMIIVTSSFSKSSVFKTFAVHTNAVSVFNFLRFEERLRKAPFLWRISVDGTPNHRNKAAFPNFSGALWMGLSFWHVVQLMCAFRTIYFWTTLLLWVWIKYISNCHQFGVFLWNIEAKLKVQLPLLGVK